MGLDGIGARLLDRLDFARKRARIVAANTALRERELIKLAYLASALADTLRKRGVSDSAASLTAEAGVSVFRIAFDRWVNKTIPRDLPQLIREVFDDLKAVTART